MPLPAVLDGFMQKDKILPNFVMYCYSYVCTVMYSYVLLELFQLLSNASEIQIGLRKKRLY